MKTIIFLVVVVSFPYLGCFFSFFPSSLSLNIIRIYCWPNEFWFKGKKKKKKNSIRIWSVGRLVGWCVYFDQWLVSSDTHRETYRGIVIKQTSVIPGVQNIPDIDDDDDDDGDDNDDDNWIQFIMIIIIMVVVVIQLQFFLLYDYHYHSQWSIIASKKKKNSDSYFDPTNQTSNNNNNKKMCNVNFFLHINHHFLDEFAENDENSPNRMTVFVLIEKNTFGEKKFFVLFSLAISSLMQQFRFVFFLLWLEILVSLVK